MWHLRGKPLEVQEQALKASKDQKGFAYFMEMGLGKTAVVLNEALDLYIKDKIEGLIIVCPDTLKENWVIAEVQKWCKNHQEIRTAIWNKLPQKGEGLFIWAINYEAFSVGGAKAADMVPKVLQKYKCMLVLDESVQIKNPQSGRAKALVACSIFSEYNRILSGKPTPQGIQDLYSQLRFIGAYEGNYWSFRNKFCVMGGFKGKKVVGIKNEEELEKILNLCSFRAKKKNWLDIPEKAYTSRKLEMTPDQKRHYKEMKTDFVTFINDEAVEAPMVIIQAMKLQQISSGFLFNEEHEVVWIEKEPPKLKELLAVLEETDSKILIPVHFKPSVRLLYEKLKDYNPVLIAGKEIMKEFELDVEEEKRKFNREDKYRVVLCQTSAAKYGHTLLGTESCPCHTTYFYENNYSLDDRVQIEDRNHRFGQKNPVLCIDLVSSPIEKAVINALQYKNDVAEAIMEKKDEF